MNEVEKANFKTACLEIAATTCYKYDEEGKRVSLNETEIVAYATAFYKFIEGK